MFLSKDKPFFFLFLGPCVLGIRQCFSFGPVCFGHKMILLFSSIFRTLLLLHVLLLRTRSISYLNLVNLW